LVCAGGIGVVCGEGDGIAVATGGIVSGTGLGTGLRLTYVPPACQQAKGVEEALEPPTWQAYRASVRSGTPYSQTGPVIGQYSISLAQNTWPAAFDALHRSMKSAPITSTEKWGSGNDGFVTVGDLVGFAVLGFSAERRHGRFSAMATERLLLRHAGRWRSKC
jgi:hypothetical protein